MMKQWTLFPTVLQRKFLLTLLAGIASAGISVIICVATKDHILLALGIVVLCACLMKIKDTVMAAVDETRFTRVVGMMREATTVQMNTTDIPGVVRLASKDFNITEEESTGVLQRLIEGKDLTLYGLSNAVTRFSQDVDSYDRATALEGIGYNILSMPRQQWNRINQMAA